MTFHSVSLGIFLLFSSTALAAYKDAAIKPLQLRSLNSIKHPSTTANQLRSLGSIALEKRQECPYAYQTCNTVCSCFGTGFIDCPGDTINCYRPGDTCYGIDSCGAPSETPVPAPTSYTPPAPQPSSPPGFIPTDFCYDGTCLTCFGPSYIDCPADDHWCYDPNNSTSVCPDGTGGTFSSIDAACEAQYGPGEVACYDACYNPSQGDVCCSDGHHCQSPNSCSNDGSHKCIPPASSPGLSSSTTAKPGIASHSTVYGGVTTSLPHGSRNGSTPRWSSSASASRSLPSASAPPIGGAEHVTATISLTWAFVGTTLAVLAGTLML